MATIRNLHRQTKDNETCYKIEVFCKGKRISRTVKIPNVWTKRSKNRELNRIAAELTRQLETGEIETRKEKLEREQREREQAAKILTVKQYADKVFLPTKARSLAPKTYDSYVWTFDKFINPTFGDMKLDDVTSAQINSFLLDLDVKHSTVKRFHSILSGFFKMAYMDYSIKVNPMDRVEVPKARKDEDIAGKPDSLTEDELRRLLECMEQEPLKWQCYVYFMAETGARRGEVCAIQWNDIDFDSSSWNVPVNVGKSVSYLPGNELFIGKPKSRKSRIVYISRGTANLLKQYRLEQSERGISQWVFAQNDNPWQPMHPDSASSYFQKISRKYGFEGLHPHELRHTFASLAITNGADVVSVSQILGHSDTSITLRTYSHANENSKKVAFNTFLEAIGK